MGWRRAMFKGSKVWVRVGADGEPAVAGGRVDIRYSDKPGAKVYGGGASRLGPLSGPAKELEAGERAEPGGSKTRASRASGFGSAKTRTKAQAKLAADAFAQLVRELPDEVVRCYTDGGCKGNPGPAGAGCRVELPDGRVYEEARSLGHGTNNIAELTAILMAMEALDEVDWPLDSQVAVFTDSSYARGVVQLGWKAKANVQLVADVKAALARRPQAILYWVAGHAGVDGNERADVLATQGVEGQSKRTWWAPTAS